MSGVLDDRSDAAMSWGTTYWDSSDTDGDGLAERPYVKFNGAERRRRNGGFMVRFVGGPLDGEWKVVPDLLPQHRVAIADEQSFRSLQDVAQQVARPNIYMNQAVYEYRSRFVDSVQFDIYWYEHGLPAAMPNAAERANRPTMSRELL